MPTLKVTDQFGRSASDHLEIIVANTPPVVGSSPRSTATLPAGHDPPVDDLRWTVTMISSGSIPCISLDHEAARQVGSAGGTLPLARNRFSGSHSALIRASRR